tara:strand:+ start:4276 stop:6279 length:2004 start_codon:yes stop_codon:yes gene_type:complete
MTFLTPFFLWLLPLVSIPTLIHLWNKYQIKELEFSTIYFLKSIESKSIKKVKLIEIILLILRTIIILLLILFISRPIIKGEFSNWINSPQSTLTAIIIDDSFSMNGDRYEKNTIELIEKKIVEIRNTLIEKQFIIYGTFRNGIQFFGIKEEFDTFMPDYEISDLNVGINKIISQIKDTLTDGLINKELYLITDLQKNSFKMEENSNFQLTNWNSFIIDFNIPNENIAIESLNINSKIILPNESFEIIVKVINNGKLPQYQRFISINVDGLDVGQQLISLNPYERKEIKFETALPNLGSYKILAKLDQDDIIKDNEFYKLIKIPEHINIGLYSNFPEDFLYIKETLSAINQKNNLFTVYEYPLSQLSNSNLKKFDILFISGFVKQNTWNKVESFCEMDNHAIVFPSLKESKFFNDKFENINPIILTNDDYILTHQDVMNNISDIALEKLLISKSTTPKYFKYYRLNNLNGDELIKLEDNSTIWKRIKIGNGFIDKLGIGFTTDWSNIPLTPGFIPFLHNWIYSGKNLNSNLKFYSGDVLNYEINNSFKEYEILTPLNKNYLLSTNNNLDLLIFENIGWYELKSNEMLLETYGVNIPQNELNIQKLDSKEIKQIFPKNKIISPINTFDEEIKSAKIGVEISNQLLILILLLLFLEMFIAHFKSNQGKNN